MKTVKLKLTIEELQFFADLLANILGSNKPKNVNAKAILSILAELLIRIQRRTFVFVTNKKTVAFSIRLSEAYGMLALKDSYNIAPGTWEWNTCNIILNEIQKQTA